MDNFTAAGIAFIFSNIPFVGLILALVIALLRSFSSKVRHEKTGLSGLLSYVFLLPIGLGGIWGFVIHAFYPQIADKFIGWHYSPFEFEVAVANLGMGLTGLIAFFADRGFRVATAVFISCFGWGAAVGHIHQMIVSSNFAPGNAGLIFYTDIIIPLLTWILLASTRDKL